MLDANWPIDGKPPTAAKPVAPKAPPAPVASVKVPQTKATPKNPVKAEPKSPPSVPKIHVNPNFIGKVIFNHFKYFQKFIIYT